MTGFPDILAEPLRARFTSLGVRPEDVAERFVRGGGPGGQKINKTSSTVWLRHHPSGVEARCQAGRSQAANRARAWAELLDKLERLARERTAGAQAAREQERRRMRQKSRALKVRMIESKKHRARIKRSRRGGFDE